MHCSFSEPKRPEMCEETDDFQSSFSKMYLLCSLFPSKKMTAEPDKFKMYNLYIIDIWRQMQKVKIFTLRKWTFKRKTTFLSHFDFDFLSLLHHKIFEIRLLMYCYHHIWHVSELAKETGLIPAPRNLQFKFQQRE